VDDWTVQKFECGSKGWCDAGIGERLVDCADVDRDRGRHTAFAADQRRECGAFGLVQLADLDRWKLAVDRSELVAPSQPSAQIGKLGAAEEPD